MKVRLGGKDWDIDDSLSDEEMGAVITKIREDLIRQGIDPYLATPEEIAEYRRHRSALYDSEDRCITIVPRKKEGK